MITALTGDRTQKQDGTLWLIGYIAVLAIPLMLIISRGGADALCTLTGVLLLVRSAITRDWNWTKDPVVRCAFAAWVWMMLAVSPFATDVKESYKVAAPWIRFPLFYASVRHWVMTERKPLESWAWITVALLALVIADTLWQYASGVSLTGYPVQFGYRLTGPFGHVKVGIYLAKLFLPPLAVLLFLKITGRQMRVVLAVLLFLMLCIATIMLSGERTAFGSSLVCASLAAGLVALSHRQWRLPIAGMLVGMMAIAAFLLMTQPAMQARLAWLQTNLGAFRNSSYGELMWTGIELGKSHIVTGTGFKGFRLLCPQYLERGDITACNIHPHNPYVEWFAETGLVGIVLFLAIITLLLRSCAQTWKQDSSARILCAFAASTVVLNFFPLMATQSFFSNWPGILLWYSVASGMAALNLVRPAQ